jgi:hypothetical protein
VGWGWSGGVLSNRPQFPLFPAFYQAGPGVGELPKVFKKGERIMTVKFELLRPDDLLNLQIEADNLHLDTSQKQAPALVLDDPGQPGYLIITFPPQTVVEQAVYESSPSEASNPQSGEPYNQHPAPSQPALPMQARIGGPSHLVFRVPPGPDVRIPYDTASLLDWGNYELVVSPLADVPPVPTPQERQNAPGIKPPAALETSIEMPYRLMISPNHAVAWRNSLQAKSFQGLTELWHTRMALKDESGRITELSRSQTAPLRAIWSPDYNPNKFNADDPPVFGQPDLDWGVLTPMTPNDRHQLVILTSAFHGFVKDKNDFTTYEPQPFYAEQFMLSPLGAWLKSRGEWDPPVPFKPLWMLARSASTAANKWDSYLKDVSHLQPLMIQNPRTPRRGAAGKAAMDALMTSMPQAAENVTILRPGTGAAQQPQIFQLAGSELSAVLWPQLWGITGAPLNLQEWKHIATQGRDHYVRIVYEGYLYPFGHRASLVKVTERKIRDVNLPAGGTTPLAYLVQHMYIVVRQPQRFYNTSEVKSLMQHGGLEMPLTSIRLTTLVTPDIADPTGGSHIPNTTYSFWVRLGSGASPNDDFKFHAIAEDIAGNRIDMTASLVFIISGEGHLDQVIIGYNNSGDERACLVPAQKVTFAPAAAGGANQNTSLTTNRLYFDTQPGPDTKDYGGFLPQLYMADVKLPAVEAMLGKPAETMIAFYPPYLSQDPNNTTGLFAQIVKETASHVQTLDKLLSEFSADQAGGFATPDLSISGLTSQYGPLAGDLAKAAQNIFDPSDFFNDVKDAAKLFGTLSLADLLAPLTMGAGAPKIQFDHKKLADPPPSLKEQLTVTLDWTPEVKDLNFGIVTFHADRNGTKAKLEVHGKVQKILELPPSGTPDPGQAEMNGSLTDFRIELLHVVEVLFAKFAFNSVTGKKLDVTVDLDPDTPVRFIEDLQFVDDLRKAIPPGLFGDGASLDINVTRVKAGFSLGLPPVGVGVFSLKDVTLGAFIELPFLDGKPLFDFSFSSREHPFNLTVMIFGGGGFFHLQIDTLGVKMLEAALEFGASASIDLGVASGGVHIMAGIYFSMQRKTINGQDVDAATLAGYLRMGGELSVLGLISVSLEFYLVFAYEFAKNAAYGRATLTVKVEVLFFSTSVEITVEKRFGGTAGDPSFLDGFTTPAVWNEYASAFA